MQQTPRFFVAFGFALLTLTTLVSSTGAQCWTCAGVPINPTCNQILGSGYSNCIYNVGDASCKLTGSCSPNGGGGGGPCAAWTEPIRVPGKSVATLALLFESDAATNAHLFGGRGHALRVVSGGAFGGLNADRVAQQIRSLSGGRPGVLPLASAFADFNNGGIALSVGHGTDGGIEFAPVANGPSAHLEVHFKGARQIENSIDGADVMPEDLLLLDVSIQGKVYVLALAAKSFDLQAGNDEVNSESIREFTQSVRSYPIRTQDPPIHEC